MQSRTNCPTSYIVDGEVQTTRTWWNVLMLMLKLCFIVFSVKRDGIIDIRVVRWNASRRMDALLEEGR